MFSQQKGKINQFNSKDIMPIETVRTNQSKIKPVFRIRIRLDPHNRRPPGSGSAWTDTDPDPGGEKLRNKTKK